MATNSNLHSLQQLSLIGSVFSEQDLDCFLRSPSAKLITSLDLSWTNSSNSILNALADSPYLNSLKILKLAKCSKINDKGF